jgi:hypothetical protein
MGTQYSRGPAPRDGKAVGITLAPGTGRATALTIVGVPLLIILVIGFVTAHGAGAAGGSGPGGSGLYSTGTQYSGYAQPTPTEAQPASDGALATTEGATSTVPAVTPATIFPDSTPMASPTVTSTTTPSGLATATGPAATVLAAYAAINRHDYQTAYSLGLGDPQPGESLQEYAAGYATTTSVTVTITGVEGDTVTVSLNAVQTNGAKDTFSGTYTVSGSHITDAQIHQTS